MTLKPFTVLVRTACIRIKFRIQIRVDLALLDPDPVTQKLANVTKQKNKPVFKLLKKL
jgi:hypothetical protein